MIGTSVDTLRQQNMTEPKTILVTGGSGFIGTAVCKLLVEAGHNVINLDRKKKEIEGVTLYPFDISNHQVQGIMQLTKPDSIIHLAADHEVGRSVLDPAVYYENNVANTINLLNCAVSVGVKEFVFSSSSSVYGNAAQYPTGETNGSYPQSPYARTKHIVEIMLEDYRKAYDFNYISLRYFNAAGALPDNSHGYTQDPASHLVPIACKKNLAVEPLTVFGNDYNTVDGTAVRDYTHVCDIATAHLAALNYIHDTECSDIINIGSGDPKSVLDVYTEVVGISGITNDYVVEARREGDVAQTFADITRAQALLGWQPQYTFKDIVEHAYAWELKHTKRKKK